MKILVLSDSHGKFNNILSIYEKEKPDTVLFSGDGCKDVLELSYAKDNSKYHIVKGNMDFGYPEISFIEEFVINEYYFLLTHGHIYGVNYGVEEIIESAKKMKINIIIFGHTHKKMYLQKEKIHLFNPGASVDGEYGIINISNNEIEFLHKKI